MNTDIRLSINFFKHIKTFRLKKACGLEGIICLQKLWVWAAQNRPTGDLGGFSASEIEAMCEWGGDEGCLISALREIRWLDGEEGSFQLHGWEEFQLWAKKAETRENIGRMGQLARKNIIACERIKAAGIKGITKEQYAKLTQSGWEEALKDILQSASQLTGQLTVTPTPTPNPTPNPAPKKKHKEVEKPKTENLKTDFERKWEGEYAQRVNPLDYIRKIQEIAKNAPRLEPRKLGSEAMGKTTPTEKILGVSGGQCPPELQSNTVLESEVNTNDKDNEENDERRRAVGQGH